LIYWSTAWSIVSIWIRSETFAHGFLVVPICLWLVWRQRRALVQLTATPWWPGLAFVLGAGALWFVMTAADVLGVKQFALAFMIEASVVTIIGLRAARRLAFPLAFLLFAIPVGEMFVPTLIDWTADFTVLALRASGIPVMREANHFVIPSGAWSVVEACSGIRYLIASVMVGTIYAAIAYRSTSRRMWFVLASILVPLVANWLRAYGIVMLGHLSNNTIAVGFDHLIYGWLFFGLVMLLLFWIGSFWQERPAVETVAVPSLAVIGARTLPSVAPRLIYAAACASVLAAGVWRPLEAMVEAAPATALRALAAPPGAGGWQPEPTGLAGWKPHYRGYAADLQQTYVRDGREVGLYVAYYVNQSKGQELITSGNVLTRMEDFAWKTVGRQSIDVSWTGQTARAERTVIAGPATRLDVARLYWVDGRVTGSEYAAKALLAWSRLRGHGDDAALIVIYAPERGDKQEGATLKEFAAEMSRPIERALADVRGDGRK